MTSVRATVRLRSHAGAAAFLVGSVLVHAGNYAFNLVAVRRLSPANYADIALTVTLLLFAGFVTVGLQMATARTVAEAGGVGAGSTAGARWFGKQAFRFGLALAALIAATSPILAATFRTGSTLPFLAVAISLPFAFATGVGRGLAQGLQRFGRLALSFQAEMVVRLGLGAGLMVAGLGVAGGVGGVAASLIVAALVVRPPSGASAAPEPADRRRLVAALWPAMSLLVGEALVNHADTIIVKQAFDPTVAGQFAAIALLGRSVFFITWPISMLLFPIAGKRAAAGEPTRSILLLGVGVVGAVGAAATIAVALAPEAITGLVLGGEYVAQAHLLAPYVAATALFSCAATIVSFGVAVGSDTAGFGAGAAGIGCTLVLALFHPSLTGIVWAQVVLMAGYVGVTAVWVLRRERTTP
jgi:O-antigen/teichoic acid export membrane protein